MPFITTFRTSVLAGIVLLAGGALVNAAPHAVRIPLHDGTLRVADLSEAVCGEMGLPAVGIGSGEVNLRGLKGSAFIEGLNTSLRQGFHLSIEPEALLVTCDPDLLPATTDDMRLALRVFTATAAPEDTARQARNWGLFMPARVDPTRPLVVLIHGLDCRRECLQPIGDLLAADGRQVAYFSYPGDEPVYESADLLEKHLRAVHETFPHMPVDIVAHSMGGLVARVYIEGPHYAGGVQHLIMVAPPNDGSRWARLSLVLEAQEQFDLYRHNPDWSPTWIITDGLGSAGKDLMPHSEFLRKLNTLHRRAGVEYTIIAGSRSVARRVEANCLTHVADLIPDEARDWWGVRQCGQRLNSAAGRLREKTGEGDGPVKLKSARLEGVDDFVVLPADHGALMQPDAGNPPAAWPVIRDRLERQ